MDVDFSDLFTVAARQAVQALAMKAQSFTFDYLGPRVAVTADADRMRRSLHRNLCVAVDCLDSGFVIFSAQAEVQGDICRIVVTSAGTGQAASPERVAEVLERSSLYAVPLPADSPAGAVRAVGTCPVADAELEFSLLPDEGVLLRASFQFTRFEVLDDELPTAPDSASPRAWIVGAEDAASDSLIRRLQRLGWAITRFDSCDAAGAVVDDASRQNRLPALAVMFEFGGVTLAETRQLRAALPPETEVVFAVVAGSPTLREPSALSGGYVSLYPLSPGELLTHTRAATGQRHVMSGETRPVPLSFADRPLVLVVDDHPVNRFVARGLVESMGYEVATAENGQEAIDECRRLSPRAVLMDVDMPVLDGLSATRELRRLQRLGEVSPCAVVAATAGTSPDYAQRCLEAGMDGFLNKPLEPKRLREELRRVATL